MDFVANELGMHGPGNLKDVRIASDSDTQVSNYIL
jgi:hypothetical protein